MRRRVQIMTDWTFRGRDGSDIRVDLPHTWNALDGQDGGNDYYRGSGIYTKEFDRPDFSGDEEVWLEFEGVNASAKGTLNAHECFRHDGGYSRFRAEITPWLQEKNLLTVEADNSVNDRIYPQKADFTFYGGIYRTVSLLITKKNHFDLAHYGTEGLKCTPVLEGGSWSVKVSCFVCGEGQTEVTLMDADGERVSFAKGRRVVLPVASPHLWDGLSDPYLYTVRAVLTDDAGTVLDEVSQKVGLRTFHVDPEKGFFLNGRSYPLRGVSRHQDRRGIGSAITREEHEEDIQLIRELGANTIRLAHYQHDQYFYDRCDELGFVVWAEIPYISEHMEKGRANTVSQMKELIVQNYHHACICFWGISNEITISTKNKKDMLDNHRLLNDLVHRMDPTRLSTLACYATLTPFAKVAHITDVVAWNLYLGWYVPGLFLNDLWIRFFHFRYKKRPLGFSEYGAEGMPNLHSARPRRGDHSEEYQALYHEYMLSCFERFPFLWGTYVWNMFDFAADARDQGGEPGMNHKGLVTFDRKTKKDSFYLYQAAWSKEPMVHICSKRFRIRTEKEIEVRVYSNAEKVSLYAGDQLLGEQTGGPVFIFRLSLSGTLSLRAEAGEVSDSAVFERAAHPEPSYRLTKKKGKSANWV